MVISSVMQWPCKYIRLFGEFDLVLKVLHMAIYMAMMIPFF